MCINKNLLGKIVQWNIDLGMTRFGAKSFGPLAILSVHNNEGRVVQ